MSLELLKKDIVSAVDSMRGELLGLSHAIHGEPELALEEFKSSARLAGCRLPGPVCGSSHKNVRRN